MDTDDRDNQRGGEEDGRYDNVVWLPRDWLGPRSELVPIGPAADRADAAKARAALGVVERGDQDPITQDGFWGGDLDSIPRPVVALPAQPAVPAESVAATAAPARGRETPRPSLPRAGRRAVALAGGLACTAAAAIAFGVAGAGSGVPSPLAAATPGEFVLPVIHAFPSLDFPNVVSPSETHSARHSPAAAIHHARARASHAHASPAVSVHSTARTSSTSNTTRSSYVTPVSSEPITHPSTTNETASKSSAQRDATKAGPIGAGAAITPGTLG